jgi:hypothetical protein
MISPPVQNASNGEGIYKEFPLVRDWTVVHHVRYLITSNFI